MFLIFVLDFHFLMYLYFMLSNLVVFYMETPCKLIFATKMP